MATSSEGTFVWYEHLTGNVKQAIAFYGEVAGWRTEPFGDGGYTMWVGTQGPLGGVMAITPDMERAGVRPHWMAHVEVGDVDATVKRATAMGGRVLHEPTDIPTVGRFAVVADPQGAFLSVFRPNQPMAPRDLAKDGEFCWNELLTSDSAAGARFWGELLGWKILEEMDMGEMGKYRIFGVGERRLGGMMTTPNPMPPAWLYYASTGDLAAAVARATARGGKLLNGPMDVPGGRIAQLADPQGGAFALHQAVQGK